MARNPEAISRALADLVQPQARGRLLAQGLARGMVWRDGVVPDGAPEFSASLTPDLLHLGYGVIGQIARELTQKLGVPQGVLLEYVLNQRDLWEDERLAAEEAEDDGDEVENTFEEHVADLDVALFSLVEPLDIEVEKLATALDDALQGSLWQRTLTHHQESVGVLEREILRSRAEWLWTNSTKNQREACFYSGLGHKPGLFLHEQLDRLVDVLCEFQAAVVADDGDAAANAAVQFAELVMGESFFAVRKLPKNWKEVLASWVNGTAFADILAGRGALDARRTQAFVQEGVVFRLVWAAEAVRVQAIATNHSRMNELGDGPAFALTYGVPRIPAALLCQMGFASRVGAVWAARELFASFTETDGLRNWLREHDALLSLPDFWTSEDHYLLWRQASAPTSIEYPRPWKHETYTVSVDWKDAPPAPANGLVRIIAGNDRSATICRADLTPLGTAQLPFDPHGAALDGRVISKGRVRIMYFGRS